MKTIVVLVAFSIAGVTTAGSQSQRDFTGHYIVPKELRHEVPNLYQLDILRDSSAKSIYAIVMFFSDTALTQVLEALHCKTEELTLAGDSLKFKTSQCAQEAYEFIGKFINKPERFEEDYLLPVLEGTLIHYFQGQLVSRKKVIFHWGGEC